MRGDVGSERRSPPQLRGGGGLGAASILKLVGDGCGGVDHGARCRGAGAARVLDMSVAARVTTEGVDTGAPMAVEPVTKDIVMVEDVLAMEGGILLFVRKDDVDVCLDDSGVGTPVDASMIEGESSSVLLSSLPPSRKF